MTTNHARYPRQSSQPLQRSQHSSQANVRRPGLLARCARYGAEILHWLFHRYAASDATFASNIPTRTAAQPVQPAPQTPASASRLLYLMPVSAGRNTWERRALRHAWRFGVSADPWLHPNAPSARGRACFSFLATVLGNGNGNASAYDPAALIGEIDVPDELDDEAYESNEAQTVYLTGRRALVWVNYRTQRIICTCTLAGRAGHACGHAGAVLSLLRAAEGQPFG